MYSFSLEHLHFLVELEAIVTQRLVLSFSPRAKTTPLRCYLDITRSS